MRDEQGLRNDVRCFRQLIQSKTSTEREMHKFFEEHPAFIMQARLGVPISHKPVLMLPKGRPADFSISPILGPMNDELELLELKGPSEKFLTRGSHGGFSAKVKSAVDQVRDYDRALSNSLNRDAILRALGYVPARPKLAVLIGHAASRNRAKICVYVGRVSLTYR